ncbi:MAG: C4-dicarboxylate TRAP transporter substrate-binding protein [Ectothiorhodospiraceae bacterium]|nr:C4-dicarboxylate TRAP transporter substrate-binding protein [Ectothiorhodospiraceae bacterium]
MKRIKPLVALAATAALIGTAAFSSASDARQLRYAVGFPAGAPVQAAQLYAQAVSEYTGGEFSVRVHELSLLNLGEMSGGVGQGIADVGYVLTLYWPSEFPHINMAADISMLLAMNEDTGGKEGMAYAGAMAELIFHHCPECNAEFDAQNQVYTGGAASTAYTLLCNKPVTSVAQLNGSRLRAGGASWARWSRGMNATPVSLPGNEIFEALNQGVVDCAMLSLPELSGLNIMDVATDVTPTVPGGVFAGAGTTNVNRDVWRSMTPDQRTAMLRAGATMGAQVSYLYKEYAIRDTERAKEQGIRFHDAEPELLEASHAFIMEDVANTAETYKRQHGVERADELIEIMNGLIDKWLDLVADVETGEALAELYWNEVYSKVDVNQHGM